MLVERHSACHSHPLEGSRQIPLSGRNHQELVKFSSAQDNLYERVLRQLKELHDDSFGSIQARFLKNFSRSQSAHYLQLLRRENTDDAAITRVENILHRLHGDDAFTGESDQLLQAKIQQRENMVHREESGEAQARIRPRTPRARLDAETFQQYHMTSVDSIRKLGKLHHLNVNQHPRTVSEGFAIGGLQAPEVFKCQHTAGVYAPDEAAPWPVTLKLEKDQYGSVRSILAEHVEGGVILKDQVPSGIGAIPYMYQLPENRLDSIQVTFLGHHRVYIKDVQGVHPVYYVQPKYEFTDIAGTYQHSSLPRLFRRATKVRVDCEKFQSAVFGKRLLMCFCVRSIRSNEGTECQTQNLRVWGHQANWSMSFLADRRSEGIGYWEISRRLRRSQVALPANADRIAVLAFSRPETKQLKHNDPARLVAEPSYVTSTNKRQPYLDISSLHDAGQNTGRPHSEGVKKLTETTERDHFIRQLNGYFSQLTRTYSWINPSQGSPGGNRNTLHSSSTFGTVASAMRSLSLSRSATLLSASAPVVSRPNGSSLSRPHESTSAPYLPRADSDATDTNTVADGLDAESANMGRRRSSADRSSGGESGNPHPRRRVQDIFRRRQNSGG